MERLQPVNIKNNAIIATLLACILSCSPAPASQASISQTAEAVTATRNERLSEGESEAPALKEAIVTFFTGTVTITADSVVGEAELGMAIPVGSTVTTGKDSQCDLQFGSLGTLRVQAETTISLSEIAVDAERRVATTRLVAGSVAAKVSKLTGRDRFNIQTSSIVCGVRGTEFMVRSGASGMTKVSVKEGSVALLPPSFDPAEIEEKAAGSCAAPAVDAVIAAMIEAAPRVASSEETSLVPGDSAEASKAWDGIVIALETAVAAAPRSAVPAAVATGAATQAAPDVADRTLLDSSLIRTSLATVSSAAAPVARKVKAASAVTAKDLETLSSIAIFQVQDAAEAPVVSTSTAAAPSASTLVPVTIVCEPGDADIFIDGLRIGKGAASALKPLGSTLELVVRRDGYKESRQVIEADSAEGKRCAVALEPVQAAPQESAAPAALPLISIIETGAGRPVGTSVSVDDGAMFLDAKGVLYRVSAKGLLWKAVTGNALPDNASPTVSGKLVYVSGDKNLSIVSVNSGATVATVPLDPNDSGLFGRRPAIIGAEAFLSASDGLRILDATTGKRLRTIAFSGGSDMTPFAYEGSVVLADRTGRFLRIDTADGKQLASVQTKAVQPVALATSISGGTAFVADRKGLISAIDIASGAILWAKKADERGSAIFDDIIVEGGAVWCYSKGSVSALSAATGDRVMPTIVDAAAPPLAAHGYIWIPMKGGRLMAHDASTGAEARSIQVGGEFSCRPTEAKGHFICPLASGSVAVIDPSAAK